MAAPSNKQDNGDNLGIVIIPLVLALGVWVLWKTERAPVIYALYAPDFVQYLFLKTIHLLGPHGHEMLTYTRACLDGRIDPKTVSFAELTATQADIGHRMRFFYFIPLAFMTFRIATSMKGENLMRRFTLSGQTKQRYWTIFGIRLPSGVGKLIGGIEGLLNIGSFRIGSKLVGLLGFKSDKGWVKDGMSFMHYQAIHWTVASTGANFSPEAKNDNMLPSKTPPEWMRDNGVGLNPDGTLNEDGAEEAFARQLGKPWTGFHDAPHYAQAILLMAHRTLKEGSHADGIIRLRGEFAMAYNAKNIKKVKEIIKREVEADKDRPKLINRICSSHAYLNTAVLAFMAWCGPFGEWDGGEGSINCPAMWLWLKDVDRTMWYVLQQHGRRMFFIEGAGAVSHYYVEHLLQSPENEPHMDGALDGLEAYLNHHSITSLETFFAGKQKRRTMSYS